MRNSVFSLLSVTGINYLYLKEKGFSQTQYGYYSGYSVFMRALGLMLIVPILKHFKMPDNILMITGTVSRIGLLLLFAFAVNKWMVFLC